jgi:hypothetical protein
MKNCEYCDYFKSISAGSDSGMEERAVCLFTDTVLFAEQERDGQEYPCGNVSYQEYLERKKSHTVPSLSQDNWKRVYKSRHMSA